jgi:hypothetical protein
VCRACKGSGGVISQCWGCLEWLHGSCAKGPKWGPGPKHCAQCWEFFRAAGVRELVLDTALMHQVVVGVEAADISMQNAEHCKAAAQHLRWDGERLWVRGREGEER